MKAEAIQALQHIRTTLAYQLTPEAIEELVGPVQRALEADVKELIAGPAVPLWAVAAYNSKVEEAATLTFHAMRDSASRGYVDPFAEDEALEAIRSLRL